MTAIVGKQNILSYTWAIAAGVGTLTVLGNNAFDLGLTDLVRIEDTTQSSTFGISATTTFAQSKASGVPTYVWTLTNLPAETLQTDTLLVYLNVNPEQAQYLVSQYASSKV